MLACGSAAPSRPQASPPSAGLLLLSLADGSERARLSFGQDPLAVVVDETANVAYVSDNAPGDVYAVALDRPRVLWKTQVGGRPGPLLLSGGHLLTSLYADGMVAELDAGSGQVLKRYTVGKGPGELAGAGQVACADGTVWDLAGHALPAAPGFALAAGPGGLWTADYNGGALVRVSDGARVALPAHAHAFWLATGVADDLLVAAEGGQEDQDPGLVLRMGDDLRPRVVAVARDPDQVAEAGGQLFVAAHGDRAVKVVQGGALATWSRGAGVVALAPAPQLGLLVVLVNARE